MKLGGAVTTANFSARTRELLTLVNLHYTGVGLLALINVYLLAQMGLAYHAARGQDAAAVAQQVTAMRTAEVQAKPLQGLDSKLAAATTEADVFSSKRLPFAYSQFLAELGALAKREGVKLTRVQYSEDPVLVEAGGVGGLTQVRLDASLSGDYRPLVLFVNSLERDRMFFLIGGVTLTGQQSGTVGLRLRLMTYLRAPVGAENTERARMDAAEVSAAPAAGKAGTAR